MLLSLCNRSRTNILVSLTLIYSSWQVLQQLRSDLSLIISILVRMNLSILFLNLISFLLSIWYQEAGGPKIPMKYGHADVTGPEQCPPEGKLPG
jgi:hypothetical protein